MVLEDRFYQVGNPGEVDGEMKEKSVKLFDDHFTQDRGWILNNGVTPPVTHERLQVGTVGYTTENPSQNEGFVKAHSLRYRQKLAWSVSYQDDSIYKRGKCPDKLACRMEIRFEYGWITE